MRRRSLHVALLMLVCCGLGGSWTAASSQGTASANTAMSDCSAAPTTAALLTQASGLLRAGRFPEAVTLLQGRPELGCAPQLNLMLAAAEAESGAPESALVTLQDANSRWPANTSIAASLARSYLQRKDVAGAARAVAGCTPDAATPLRELQVIAYVDLESHQLVKAEQVGILAYQAHPAEETLLFVANVLQLQGRSQDVVKLLGAHREGEGDSAKFLVTLAESEFDAGLYAAGRRDAERAVALAPGSYPAHYVLGNVLVKVGDLAGAVKEYQVAEGISPAQPRTYFQMGRALDAEGHGTEAAAAYRQALAVDDRYAPAYCEMAKMKLRANQVQGAIDDLKRALEANPAYQESWFLLVQAYSRAGDREKSRATLDEWNAYKQAHALQPAGVDKEDALLPPAAR